MRARNLFSCATAAASIALLLPAFAHHSFAMYDVTKTYVFTGVVLGVSPDANHFHIFFAPLNEERTEVIRDAKGAPWRWSVEMDGAAMAARYGVTGESFPPGTVVSIGLQPLRNGFPGGGRGKNGLFKCPPDSVPAPGKHCDSVPGATSHGAGVLPAGAASPTYEAAH
jgi:hypothetical protein